MTRGSNLKKRHPLESLGNVKVQSGEIRVERIEHRLKPRVPFPHRHDFYHLLFIEKGHGWHEIDFVKYILKPQQLFIMRPGEVHAWKLGSSTRGFVLEFTQSSVTRSLINKNLISNLNQLPSMILASKQTDWQQHLKLMYQEFHHQQEGYKLSLENLLLSFLVKLARIKKQKATKTSALIEKFQDLIEHHFHTEHAVEFYAKTLDINAKSLTQQISKILGKSAGAVIQERILVEAKRLLAYEEHSVAAIGYELGFEDPNYFARFFRQRAGMAPGQYRRLALRSIPV